MDVRVDDSAIGVVMAVLEDDLGGLTSEIDIEVLREVVVEDLGAVVGVEDLLGTVLDGE